MNVAVLPTDGKLRLLSRPTLIRRLKLPVEAEALLDPQPDPTKLLDQLCANGLLAEAARLLAYALPEREAVWWGCMCVRHTAQECQVAERRALDAAEAWVWHPNELNGRQAARVAVAAGYDVPGAWTALAAYWGQRPGREPGRVGRGIETATTLAAGRHGGEMQPVLRRFIASGRDIAAGGAGRLPATPRADSHP